MRRKLASCAAAAAILTVIPASTALAGKPARTGTISFSTKVVRCTDPSDPSVTKCWGAVTGSYLMPDLPVTVSAAAGSFTFMLWQTTVPATGKVSIPAQIPCGHGWQTGRVSAIGVTGLQLDTGSVAAPC